MSDLVIRFGGSNVSINNSVQNLVSYLDKNAGRRFVVISAIPDLLRFIENGMGQVFNSFSGNSFQKSVYSFFTETTGEIPSQEFIELTDQLVNLLKGISLIGDYSIALKGQVLSYSEKLTAEVLKAQFAKQGKNCFALWPEDIDLLATPDFGNATLISVNLEKINRLDSGIYLIPGSYGMTQNGKIARTGKTAADYTSAFLVSELNLHKLELWGLDNEFCCADPVIVPNPQKIARLTYSEASELAYFDHYSFHPRTVEPLEPKHIPILVLNTSTSEGIVDTIINTETYVENNIVKAVAHSEDISLLRLDGPGVGLKPGILARVTGCLNDASINIKSVITSQISINLILEESTGEKAFQHINKLGFTSVKEIQLIKDVSLIGVIGHGMQENYGVSAKIFTAVAQNKINVLLSGSGASDLVSYLVVKSCDKEKSVKQIYNSFFQ